MEQEQRTEVSSSIRECRERMETLLPLQESFDVIRRDIIVGERESSFYFIDGFSKDEVLVKILDIFQKISAEDMPADATEFAKRYGSYTEVDILGDYDEIVENILSGVTVFFLEGYGAGIALDCRTYPARSVEEPEKDRSLRGSRDGFVETIVWNTALMRRRIRDPNLIMEMKTIGSISHTDVALCYMADRVDTKLLEDLRNRMNHIQTEDLRMNQQSLARCLYDKRWISPFPKFKFTERPDTAAACLAEGKIVILVDNAPSALILPTSVFDMIEEANDYYFPTLTSVYLKVSRVLITIATVFVTPVFLLYTMYPQWLPHLFRFILLKERANIPVIWQFLILELAIDGLRLAALSTPSMLSTPLSVIAGLVLGEFSVKSGWFNAEVMLYMAFVAVANYTQPNFELGYALKFMRLLLLIVTALLGVWGFIAGTIVLLLSIVCNHTLSGRSYLRVR